MCAMQEALEGMGGVLEEDLASQDNKVEVLGLFQKKKIIISAMVGQLFALSEPSESKTARIKTNGSAFAGITPPQPCWAL